MNVNVKPRAPFQKRKPSPIAAQATGSAETFVRYVIARAIEQLERKRDAYKVALDKFPGDARLRTVIRATAEPPADLSNTPALAVMGTDYVESLQPVSAAAQLFRASRMMLRFDRYAAIQVPDLFGIDDEPPPWVAPGDPAPVGELSGQTTELSPFKLEFIVSASREMLLGSNAEALIGDLLRKKVAFGLDQILFDALPATAARPAGLRSYNTRLPESQFTSGNENAMMADVGAFVSAAEHIAGGDPFYLIGRSRRIQAMRQMYHGQVPPNLVLLPSAASLALPESVLLCVVPAAVPSAIGLPEVELVQSGAVEMDDAPGSTDLMQGASVRSFFQSDTFGIKVRLPASWGLRHPAGANWITCLWPADMGAGTGGGIPDAPADQFHYGRHQSAWEMVAEEAPIDGQIYGRQSTAWTPIPPAVEEAPPDGWTYGRRNTGWQQLEQIFANVNSPTFTGQPRAPHPAPFDDTTQLATTAWTRATIATEGAGGGIPEVPATNGAYARVWGAGGATWQDFVTLGVAPLVSPAFTGNPTAPTQPGGSRDARIATCEFVIDELAGVATGFLPLTGGTLTGPLTVPSGGNVNNAVLAFGDALTGMYRVGGAMGFTVGGVGQMQLMGTLAAFFVPVNMGNFTIQSLGDPANPTDALNLRTGDTRYMRSGGPIIAPPGTAPTDVGLGVGDASTGLYRAGTSLAIAALGDVHMLFNANRTAQLMWPLAMQGNVISNLADATAADHALSRGAGDARYVTPIAADARYLQLTGGTVSGPVQLFYAPTIATHAVHKLYVDDAVAAVATPTALRTQVFEPNEVIIVSPSGPMLVHDVNVDVPAQGLRYLLVEVDPLFSVATNPANPAYSLFYTCGLTPPGIEVPVLVYSWRQQAGGVDTDFWRASAKFRAVIDASPGSIRVQVYVRCATTGNPNLIQLGANSAANMRSLVSVTDLGPI